jgi:DNA-binding transcriptional LysR family regulator
MSAAADGRATWKLHGPGEREFELQHRPVYTADDMFTLRFALNQSTGMTVLPDYLVAHELNSAELVQVLPGWSPARGIMHAVFPSRRGLVPAVRRFLDFLGENVKEEGFACQGVAGNKRERLA